MFRFMKFAFFVSMLVFLASPAYAAIEPPYKEIEYCYRIDNISAFPDFALIARFPSTFEGYSDPIQLNEGECYARNTRDEIVAVRKEHTLNSGIRTPVSPVKIYDPQDPRRKIEDIFTIDALDDQTFSLRLAKKIVTFDDGTSEEKVYATVAAGLADPPGPGYEYTDTPITIAENPVSMDRAWYQQDWAKGLLAFGIVILILFGVMAWSKKSSDLVNRKNL